MSSVFFNYFSWSLSNKKIKTVNLLWSPRHALLVLQHLCQKLQCGLNDKLKNFQAGLLYFPARDRANILCCLFYPLSYLRDYCVHCLFIRSGLWWYTDGCERESDQSRVSRQLHLGKHLYMAYTGPSTPPCHCYLYRYAYV